MANPKIPDSGYYLETSQLSESQLQQLFDLWNQEYPSQLAMPSLGDLQIHFLMLDAVEHVLLTGPDQQLKGWASTFDREGERWFAMIVDQTFHRQGHGRQLLSKLKAKTTVLNGWVIDHDRYVRKDGLPYPSPLGFYLKNGFNILPECRLELDIISAAKIRWVALDD